VLKIVVGLGNPGAKYDKTRHNAGFVFLDHLASVCGVSWSLQSRFQGALAECTIGSQRLVLLKPQTFMNLSGVSVGGVLGITSSILVNYWSFTMSWICQRA